MQYSKKKATKFGKNVSEKSGYLVSQGVGKIRENISPWAVVKKKYVHRYCAKVPPWSGTCHRYPCGKKIFR